MSLTHHDSYMPWMEAYLTGLPALWILVRYALNTFQREVHFVSSTMQQVGVHNMYMGEVNMFPHVLDGGALHWHNCAAGCNS